MKRLNLILLLVLLGTVLASCVAPHSASRPFTCDPALLPYVELFQSDSVAVKGHAQSLVNLSVRFGQPGVLIGQGNSGLCTIYSDGLKVVEIDPTYWSSHNETTRQALMYHELGHCVLLRDHVSETIPITGSWTPQGGFGTGFASIMNPYSLVDDSFWSTNRNYYITELFR